MSAKSERLAVLSNAEHEALYGLLDFNDAQRLEYLALSETELAFASSRPASMPRSIASCRSVISRLSMPSSASTGTRSRMITLLC